MFVINVPVGVLALVAASRLVPDSKDPSHPRIPDLFGALVLAISVGALSLGLVKTEDWGWTGIATLVSFTVAVVGAAIFVWRMFSHRAPIVDPALLSVRSFFSANVTALLFCTAFGAILPSFVLRLQEYAGYDALTTGLAVAPGPLMVPLFASVSQRLGRRLSAGVLVAIGNVGVGVGAAMMALTATTDVNYATQLLPGWIVVGIGVGFALPNLLAAATLDLPPDRAATGSGIVNTSRQLGYVFGVAMLVAVLGTLTASADDALTAFCRAWWIIAAVSLLAAVSSLGITPRSALRTPRPDYQ